MGSAKWWGVTNWYIDPAQTHGGSDENDGLTSSTPLKSIAEWRRRIRGAIWTSVRITIHVLSSSALFDDGQFYGFTTDKNALSGVTVLGTPTVVGTGTITTWAPYSGNVRGKITDTAIPASWTASGFVSTAATSRFIRRTGAGSTKHAYVAKDLGSNTVQVGPVINNDDTSAAPAFPSETTFTQGDPYEVYSLPQWPMLVSQENVHYKNLDVFGSPFVQNNTGARQNIFTLCGFIGTGATVISYTGGNLALYACGISGGPALFNGPGSGPVLCTFVNVLVQQVGSSSSWKGLTNIFIGCRLYLESAGQLGSTGLLRMYDIGASGSIASAVSLIQGSTGANAWVESMVGEGNVLAFVSVDRGSQIYGATNITTTTTAAHPYIINSVNHDTPAVETSGDAVYA